ncbi:MAG: ABC transporter substrate-binding protein [Bacillota bacterium]|nr:ABC transporter substrate-binding protein [Bacillota bacterium]
MLRRQLLALLIVLLLISAFSFGCGPSEPVVEPDEETPEPSVEGPVYLRKTFSWPTYIDPAIGSDFSSSTAMTNLYDTLIYPKSDGSFDPHLARDWEVSEDNLTYRFFLNEGVMFHDGSELTAEDVKFSFDRLVAIGEGFAYIFGGRVESVEVIDDYTVDFHLPVPFGPFLTTLTRLYIVNKDLVMDNLQEGPYGDFGDYGKEFLNTNDAGSGAYKVKEFDVATTLVLEKFDDYFAFIDPMAPDIFELIGTTEAATVRTGMMRREIEISDQWQTLEAFNSLEATDGVEIARWPDGGQLYLMMNTQNPPLDDIHVRRALSWAFNYDALVQNIYPGTEQAKGPVSSVLPGWNPNVMQYSYDLEKAEQELALSKYAGQFDQYPIEYAWTAEVADLEKIALMTQAEAQKIGLTVEIVKTPWMTMIDRAGSEDTTPHIMSIWVSPHYGEAGSILEAKYHSSNTGSWEQTEWLNNAEVDALIEQAMATVDREERFAIYMQIQDLIVDLAPTIFAYDNMERHAYQSYYIEWPQANDPIPVMGYNLAARFIRVDPVKRAELLGN